ncbi:HdaA/DnaA family protein [Pseudoalteromonas sp. OFAV1]
MLIITSMAAQRKLTIPFIKSTLKL